MAAGLEHLVSWNKAQGEKNVCSFQLEIQVIANDRIKCEKRRQEEKDGSNHRKKQTAPAKIV